MPRSLRFTNRAPWTDAERAIILRPGITETQAATELWVALQVRRSSAAVGIERRRLRKENPAAVTTCDTCKHRSGWRTALVCSGPEKSVVADCLHPVWPEWWKARNERPIVSPGAGSACKKYEPRPAVNVKGEPR